ncbi:GNAT family N-acetyltransferase [Shewanella sp. WXL01]|uniref:GNAT family N-acyltransferase n=1 Tax=Shewanella sp. WXL01 TaxID=2709721 RepID=UPI0014383758|nr:GNAT family N-acyltransferase [Shewanella sp. WXL01]NKF51533.1 GNAT family N-acetyltransferase [Shewanella sp. WXL01]
MLLNNEQENNNNNALLNVEQIVKQSFPRIEASPWLAKPTKAMLKYLLHEEQCNTFAEQFAHLQGVDFVEQVLATFNVSYTVPDKEVENIPSEGRVVIYANHPIGSMDALVLIKLISQFRPDIKVVANELLMAIKPLHSILLPVRNMTGGTPKQHLNEIHQHLNNEGAVLIFPAGEVSRLRPHGVTDLKWHTGFLRIARSCDAPLLPIYVNAKNSAAFYSTSMIYKPLASLLLVKEMFKQTNKTLPVKIGELIAKEVVSQKDFPIKTQVKLLKNHLYRVGKGRDPIFNTQKAIAHPESKQAIQHALKQCEHLGETPDNKQIYLYRHEQSSPIMREIGRLREVAFRAVGEGTGKKRDIDRYDSHYLHLVLWDKDDLEIVGAYRFACAKSSVDNSSLGLYSQTLFKYSSSFEPYFERGLELGRSFVQPKYWGRRSLEYLWLGIGAFLTKNPQYRYLFGPVSLSASYPQHAKELMTYFYQSQFADTQGLAHSFKPYQLPQVKQRELAQVFCGANYSENFKILKRTLANMGVSVPTLFKQYAELCDNDGVKFIDFGTDPDFGDCIDGLVLVDVNQLKPNKRQKYLCPTQ